MAMFRWNSLQDLIAIQERMNRLFEECIHRTDFPDDGLEAGAIWSPAADVYESPDQIVFHIELPGVRLEDIHLEAVDGKLRLTGVRPGPTGADPKQFVRMERIYGDFSREFPLPATIDTEAVRATLKDGVLKIEAPKSEGPRPIALQSGGRR